MLYRLAGQGFPGIAAPCPKQATAHPVLVSNLRDASARLHAGSQNLGFLLQRPIPAPAPPSDQLDLAVLIANVLSTVLKPGISTRIANQFRHLTLKVIIVPE
jgi:hypothetical protein